MPAQKDVEQVVVDEVPVPEAATSKSSAPVLKDGLTLYRKLIISG